MLTRVTVWEDVRSVIILRLIFADKNHTGSPGILWCQAPLGFLCVVELEETSDQGVTKRDHNALQSDHLLSHSVVRPGSASPGLERSRATATREVRGERPVMTQTVWWLPPGQRLGQTFLANQRLGWIVGGLTRSVLVTNIL